MHEMSHMTLNPLFFVIHERNFCFTASAFELLIFFSLSSMSLIYFIVSDKSVVISNFVIDCDRKLKFARIGYRPSQFLAPSIHLSPEI
jgi:hypothetical protein